MPDANLIFRIYIYIYIYIHHQDMLRDVFLFISTFSLQRQGDRYKLFNVGEYGKNDVLSSFLSPSPSSMNFHCTRGYRTPCVLQIVKNV